MASDVAGAPTRSAGNRLRGAPAGRWTAAVLIGVVAGAVAALVLAGALDKQRYLLLLPPAMWRSKAVVVTAAPALLGLAWWLLTRGRRAAIACVAITALVQVAAGLAGYLLFVMSELSGEIPSEGPEVIAVSPAARSELVRSVHGHAIGGGPYEIVRVRSRAGLASRESAGDLVRCNTGFYEYAGLESRHVVTNAEVKFIDETTVEVTSSGVHHIVRFDPETLRIERTIELETCPHLLQSGPPAGP